MNPLQQRFASLVCTATLLFQPLPAFAAEPSDNAARPAFEAHSELFELVGHIKEGRLTLTLDRWASNEPIAGARIEIDLAGRNLIAEAQADGTYTLDTSAFSTPATYPLTITVTAGEDSDLLATDFVIGDAATVTEATAGINSRQILIIAAMTLLAVAVAALARRRKGEST